MRNLEAARAVGVPVVACYYWNFPTMSAQQQIDGYSEAIHRENPDFIAVDMEDETTGKSSQAISENARFLCAGLQKNFPKKKVVPYTSWNYITKFAPDANSWLGNYDAWIAGWVEFDKNVEDYLLNEIKVRPNANDKPAVPDAWKFTPWKIWQYSSSMRPRGFVNPMKHQYDWDVFNGSLDDLKAWAGMPTAGGKDVTVSVNVVDVNVQTSPDLEARLSALEAWARTQGYAGFPVQSHKPAGLVDT